MRSRSELDLLVVEDDEPKLSAIERFLKAECPHSTIAVARSMTSAVERISGNKFHLVIVDMSLPTYDFSKDRAGGGRPQGYGGEDILRFVESESPGTACVVLTQYEEFSDGKTGGRRSLDELRNILRRAFGDMLLGVVHYSGQQGEWRESLMSMIRELKDRKS